MVCVAKPVLSFSGQVAAVSVPSVARTKRNSVVSGIAFRAVRMPLFDIMALETMPEPIAASIAAVPLCTEMRVGVFGLPSVNAPTIARTLDAGPGVSCGGAATWITYAPSETNVEAAACEMIEPFTNRYSFADVMAGVNFGCDATSGFVSGAEGATNGVLSVNTTLRDHSECSEIA